MHYNQYITSGQTSYKLREHFSMMILSIVATVVLLGALFYHRVSLLLSSVILLALDRGARRGRSVEYLAAAAAGDHTVAV
ncbi:hypothetical protein IE989_04970 [Klebsiella pneumoniae]|nr:hypothetical protein [Klebsiella pneumoniae]